MRTPKERLDALTPEQVRRLYDNAEGLYLALCHVQTALARWRDGESPALQHPEHGDLCLEEVKYCVVDPALDAVDDSDKDPGPYTSPPRSLPVATPDVPGRVIATVRLQEWRNDYAYPVGRLYFDVTQAVEEMGREEALDIEDNSFESDYLVQDVLSRYHRGPFEVEVAEQIRVFFGEEG